MSFEKYESASLRGWGSDRKLLPETVVYWDYLAGCYWYWNATRMAEMAKALGREDDEAKFKRMAAEAHGYVKSEFFIDGEKREWKRGLNQIVTKPRAICSGQ